MITIRLLIIAILIVTCGCQSDTAVFDADGTEEQAQRTSQLQSLLMKMSDDELFAVGITAVHGGLWSIAWSTDSEEDVIAINNALKKVNLSASGSFNHGRGGWYIEKGDFFVAQAALKQSQNVRRLGIRIVEPELPRH
jgi:hypothetical protein